MRWFSLLTRYNYGSFPWLTTANSFRWWGALGAFKFICNFILTTKIYIHLFYCQSCFINQSNYTKRESGRRIMWHFYMKWKIPPICPSSFAAVFCTNTWAVWALEQDAESRFMQPICCEDKHGWQGKYSFVNCKLLRYFSRVSLECCWS